MNRTTPALLAALLALAACDDWIPAPSPRNGATGVPLDAEVVVPLPGDFEPSSLATMNVSFTRRDAYGPFEVAFTAVHDAAGRRLLLRPTTVFKRGLVHDVRVSGLVAGDEPFTYRVSFRTLRNPQVLYENQWEGAGLQRREREVDEEGLPVKVTSRYSYDLNESTWVEDITWDAAGRVARTFAHGDGYSQRQLTSYDADGFPTECVTFCGNWETSCGPGGVFERTRWTRDAQGRIDAALRVMAGPDGAMDTPDDAWMTGSSLQDYYDNSSIGQTFYGYADDGTLVRVTQVINPGPDGLFQTEDDVSVAVIYEDGVQRMVVPGADGRYGTADDRVLWRETFTFNADGTVASETSNSPSHITFTYDGHGARVEAVNRWSAGPDGVWDTDDDEIAERWTYLTDR